MSRSLQVGLGAIAALSSLMLANTIHAQSTAQSRFKGNLTIEVSGLQNQKACFAFGSLVRAKAFLKERENPRSESASKLLRNPCSFPSKSDGRQLCGGGIS